MTFKSEQISIIIRLKSHSVKFATKKSPFRLLMTKNIHNVPMKHIFLISKSIATWDPFEDSEKCIICWKLLSTDEKDKSNYMECPHCHQKAHQDHMLRWLAKKKYCPYCQAKW